MARFKKALLVSLMSVFSEFVLWFFLSFCAVCFPSLILQLSRFKRAVFWRFMLPIFSTHLLPGTACFERCVLFFISRNL